MSKVPADFKISGVIAAPGTALTEKGDVNPDAVPAYADWLVDNQIDGVFALGTLGEGMSLTVEERKVMAAAWVDAGKGRFSSVIVHVGTSNIRDTVALARHAQEIGATAIACMLPSFFKPANEAVAVEYLREVAAAAPDTPFYYYCINFMTGIYLDTAKILTLASACIPNLRGAKISSRELPSLLDSSKVAGMQVMVGTDEQYLPMLSIGLRVPVVNSYLGPLYKRLMAVYDSGDIQKAREEMALARRLVHLRSKYLGGPALVKAIMRCLGVDLGPVRSPLVEVDKALLSELKTELGECGLPVV